MTDGWFCLPNIRHMMEAPIPPNEAERISALRRLHILDTPSEERFDCITRLALQIFKVPISTLSIVDSGREWFKSAQGITVHEGERAISFCGHALLSDGTFVIPDTKNDPRFADNPMVIGPPFIRFYAGVPIMSIDGQRVGVLCVKDYVPRDFDKKQSGILTALANWAELELNFHELGKAIEAQHRAEKISDANQVLKLLNVILRHDILNDLSIIKGSLHLLIETKNDRYIADSLKVVERSITLIETMRSLEAAAAAGAALKRFRLLDVIEKVRQNFPEIAFSVEGDCAIMADEAIYSVFENLFRNAKVHGEAKNIAVTLRETDGRVECVVSNDGKDMPAGAKNHLFEEGFPFGKTGHTGLGLYIVRKTVQRYGGTVTVEDNKPQGARFIFSLPPSA